MEYVKLGNSDLKVSRICLGGMNFGDPIKSGLIWLINQEETDKIVKTALDKGINFFDVSNNYGSGTSEIYLGNSLKKFTERKNVIIATKVYFNEGHLSKEAINREIEGSLSRLQTDYIDLYIIHRWDYATPIEETMETLNELVKKGKVRYLGCSSMYSYQLLKAQECARQHGWAQFISLQDHYNLIYREEERQMLQLVEEEGMMITPYAPLAGGRLTRDWESDSLRFKGDLIAVRIYDSFKDMDLPIVNRVKEISLKHNVSMAIVALSWLLSKKIVAAPIVGPTKVAHVEDACAAINFKLSPEEIKYLEELYKPHQMQDVIKKGTA